jgi:hypothetical protein
VICVAIFVIWSKLAPDGPGFDGSEGPMMIVILPLLFYVFGIFGWFIPYMVLSVILFVWSFRSRAQTLMKVFALSPVVMAVIILIFVNALALGDANVNEFMSDPAANAQNFLGTNVWYAAITLFWGFLCVGIGYGIYKLLQRRDLIKDEEVMLSMPLNETS